MNENFGDGRLTTTNKQTFTPVQKPDVLIILTD